MVNSEILAAEHKIFSVSELNREIKRILEKKYAFIWISGEISNLSKAASGHVYLTLKDRKSQIAGVIFRTQTRLLKEKLENGMQVTGFGRISVYEPKGTYQIILEYLERSGIGELLIELEALKAKLRTEGLFDDKYKKELPFLPEKIAVITSPTGAAIEDILNISQRRFENIPIQIVPVSVQGKDAGNEIVNAFNLVNDRMEADVIILARGGGSVEDLQPFNSERVARAIFASTIPVVSAVGHETDYTIADLASDLRAPTPSAAAELILPVKADLVLEIEAASERIVNKILILLDSTHQRLAELSKRIVHPRKRLDDSNLRLDELHERLVRAITSSLQHHRHRLQSTLAALTAMNPKAILQRGFSITQKLQGKEIIRDAAQVIENDELEIILAKGTLRVKNIV